MFSRENVSPIAVSAVPRLVVTDECGSRVQIDDEHLFETNLITLRIAGVTFTPEQEEAISAALGAWKYGPGPVEAEVFEAQIKEVVSVH